MFVERGKECVSRGKECVLKDEGMCVERLRCVTEFFDIVVFEE